ncbi:MAG: FAD-binding oxidoreductase [Labilithrix sp.]|nr:FAD-binding oxidoreductase [Labilithrix sp.]MCW5812748.1 FAD-binding oxidoreductase [Labilithrix sp.]
MSSARSFWAWGYDEKFPNDDVRKSLAGRLAQVFGAEPTLRPLPGIASAKLPEPRYQPPVELKAFGTTDARVRASHTYGRGYKDLVRGFSGDFSAAPDWVFHPSDEAQLALLFRFCEAESIAFVPYGGGTNVVGATEHRASGRHRGTACVDMSKMDKVLEIDTTSRSARIQAGATGPRISLQLAAQGLTLRHYPQSFELSTLGGWIATRAGGHYATLYTHIDDLVQALRVLTPAGVLETRRVPASGAGPAPERLFLGSEGVLGVITEAWVRVQPRPRWRASASVHFDRFADGIAATRALSQSGLYPSNCRLLDEKEAMLHRVTKDGKAVLLLAFESADHPVEPWMERALSIATDLNGNCEEEPKYFIDATYSMRPGASQAPPPSVPPASELPDMSHEATDAATWKRSFFDAPYMQSALVSLGVVCDTFETACTWEKFPALHAAVTSAVEKAMQEVCGGGIITCRFTHVYPDGPAPYYTFIAPGRADAEIEQWTAIKAAAMEAILANGGTVTHHHAVGRTHRPWYEKERPALFESTLLAAKDKLDPQGILNPGCLLPAKG